MIAPRPWRAMPMRLLLAAFLTAFLAVPGLAVAANPSSAPTAQDTARITAGAGADMRGRTAVNQAAGIGNAQVNLAAIALSDGGIGIVGMNARQHPGVAAGAAGRAASAQIQGGAFAGSQGLLSLNQAAGSGNAQANLFAIGQYPLGPSAGAITGLDDAALAAVAGQTSSESADTTVRVREARIADGAFRGSQGVVQVNQTAGVGNLSTNAIVLQLPGRAP